MTMIEVLVIFALTTLPLSETGICTITDTKPTVEISCVNPLSGAPLTKTIKREHQLRDNCESLMSVMRDRASQLAMLDVGSVENLARIDHVVTICRSGSPTQPKRDVCATLRQLHDVWFPGRTIICRRVN